jgi:hypothetical protein
MAIAELDLLCSKSPEVLTPFLREEVASAFQAVLSFDELSPEEIKRRVGVPHIRVGEADGEEINLGWITLGGIAEFFPDYIKRLKKPPPDSGQTWVYPLELATFLLVLKQHEPLRGLRDFFTEHFDFWHEFQGISLKKYFLGEVESIRREERVQFYQDADFYEQVVILTDYIHAFCLATPPLSEFPMERFDIAGDRSWLDMFDGKDMGYLQGILSHQREV